MDIKEIALKVADSLRNKVDGVSHMQSNQGLVRFAEALIAELAKQNEPVGWYSKQYGFCYMHKQPDQFKVGSILYLKDGTPAWRIESACSKTALINMKDIPHGAIFYEEAIPLPTASQIEQETAEAIAEYCRNQDHYCLATEIGSPENRVGTGQMNNIQKTDCRVESEI